MNRQQRRNLVKKIEKRGFSEGEAKNYVEILNNADAIRSQGVGNNTPPNEFSEGDKVKLNLEFIKSRKNYERMANSYKEFVEANEGVVFTAHIEHKNLISLVENPRWLFWSGDLIKVDEKSE